MSHKLVLATRNQGKIIEFRRILDGLAPGAIELIGVDQFPDLVDVEETGSTFEENSLLKARYTSQATGLPAIADDSGLCVDALNGNLATTINLVTGREKLIEKNYKITVAKSLAGKAIDFVQTVAGLEFPFTEIPGDYLTNPANPVINRPVPKTEFGKIFQDATGVLGSLLGIQRRPKASRKPSDLMIEYLSDGQKGILYDNLSFSKYAFGNAVALMRLNSTSQCCSRVSPSILVDNWSFRSFNRSI